LRNRINDATAQENTNVFCCTTILFLESIGVVTSHMDR